MAADNGQMSFRRGVMSLVILGLLKKRRYVWLSACAGNGTEKRRANCYTGRLTVSCAL